MTFGIAVKRHHKQAAPVRPVPDTSGPWKSPAPGGHPVYYHGRIDPATGAAVVSVDHGRLWRDPEPLPPALGVAGYSPDGFDWGYSGAAPRQLAVAILADATGWPSVALAYHQEFCWQIVARLPRGREWSLPRRFVLRWLRSYRSKLDRSRRVKA